MSSRFWVASEELQHICNYEKSRNILNLEKLSLLKTYNSYSKTIPLIELQNRENWFFVTVVVLQTVIRHWFITHHLWFHVLYVWERRIHTSKRQRIGSSIFDPSNCSQRWMKVSKAPHKRQKSASANRDCNDYASRRHFLRCFALASGTIRMIYEPRTINHKANLTHEKWKMPFSAEGEEKHCFEWRHSCHDQNGKKKFKNEMALPKNFNVRPKFQSIGFR